VILLDRGAFLYGDVAEIERDGGIEDTQRWPATASSDGP
jgi:hypothetical protein